VGDHATLGDEEAALGLEQGAVVGGQAVAGEAIGEFSAREDLVG